MNATEYFLENLALSSWIWVQKPKPKAATFKQASHAKTSFDPLQLLRQWINKFEVRDRNLARRLCKLIPSQCPFERDIKLLGRPLFHIPPMCKLNPLYEEVLALRFRALCYLADECGEDISAYC